MSTPAQVRSTDAIEALSAALVGFADRVQNGLDALDAEMHRAADWIEHDRPGHWKAQTREADSAVHEAKLALERCLLMTTVDGQRPACREQKAALAEAKRRLDYCRDKAERVRHWQRNFRHEMFEYDGRIGQLRGLLDQEVPAARGVLVKIIRRLEEYQIERAPESGLTGEVQQSAPAPLPLTKSPGQEKTGQTIAAPNAAARDANENKLSGSLPLEGRAGEGGAAGTR